MVPVNVAKNDKVNIFAWVQKLLTGVAVQGSTVGIALAQTVSTVWVRYDGLFLSHMSELHLSIARQVAFHTQVKDNAGRLLVFVGGERRGLMLYEERE